MRHPQVETNLGCSRCGDPICPQCLIQTQVGARCPSCANVQRSPLVSTTNVDLAKATGAGIGTAIALSAIYVIVLPLVGNLEFLLGLIAPAGIGYAVGEVIHRASGYRRNPTLAWVAGISVTVGFASMMILLGFLPVGPIGMLIGIFIAVQRVRP
jgi:hypothetical protein